MEAAPESQEEQASKIAQEIYAQLIEELKQDMEVMLLNDPRVNSLPAAAHRHDENPHNRSQPLSESGRFPIFDRRGIQTDLFAIERYVEEVYLEVQGKEQKSYYLFTNNIANVGDRQRFLTSIMEPLSKNPREVLNQLQNSEIGSYEHFEQHYPAVLPLETYLKLERRRKDQRSVSTNDTTSSPEMQNNGSGETRNFLSECEHIHNKVLFDCINDSLLQFKPFGKEGSPLPWSRQNRRLKPIEDFTIEEMFEIVKHDVSVNKNIKPYYVIALPVGHNAGGDAAATGVRLRGRVRR
jgi:hypothetical protein